MLLRRKVLFPPGRLGDVSRLLIRLDVKIFHRIGNLVNFLAFRAEVFDYQNLIDSK